MSKSRFYNFPETVSNGLTDENIPDVISNNNNNNEEISEDNDDDLEYLQHVPYSSSSIDRSSIGSIPWADDAIKQNQLDWEKVERMLHGEDALPEEPDLRIEIVEWQTKFPQLLRSKTALKTSQDILQEENFDSNKQSASQLHNLPDDLVSHLTFNSSDDDEQYDELNTPTAAAPQRIENLGAQFVTNKTPITKSYADRLSAKMALLRIAALPIHSNQRHNALIPQQISTEREHSGTSNSLRLRKVSPNRSQPPKPSPKHKQHKDTYFETQQRFHMPPILNVLESRRRFRDLTSNKSFVQLTRVKPPHAKSAAIIRQAESSIPVGVQPRATSIFGGHQSVWQKPLIATRVSSNFFNSRNAIILPALNTQRVSAQQRRNSTTTSTGADTRTQSLSNSNLGSSTSSSAGIDLRPHYAADRFVSRWQHINPKLTSTSKGTVSTGRSISAAVHHYTCSNAAFGELYVPYNTHKHGGFQ